MLSSNYSSFDKFVEETEKNFGKAKNGDMLGKSIYQEYRELPSAQGRVI